MPIVLVNQAFKFRIYTASEQEKILSQQFGACCFVYNPFLRTWIDYHAVHKCERNHHLNHPDTAKMLTRRKRQCRAWP